ncbi:hypothetical protein psyc5s11_22120 [Clostridium gelidum]|uniref:Uncharacterized protein n=1 Tax=Clostridium gelidum TaxID=704125 RepID=A0ABN6IYR5_9CLOT|nr:hypothetical protein psyc5s11_22120 [Clostridium gelidum]
MLNIIPSLSKISVVGIYNCASALFINVHIYGEEYYHIYGEEYAPKMRAKVIWGRKDSCLKIFQANVVSSAEQNKISGNSLNKFTE